MKETEKVKSIIASRLKNLPESIEKTEVKVSAEEIAVLEEWGRVTAKLINTSMIVKPFIPFDPEDVVGPYGGNIGGIIDVRIGLK